MANFTIFNNDFTGGGQVVGNIFENSESIDYSRILTELQEIKLQLEKGSKEFELVERLENSARSRDLNGISCTIKEFASKFAVATLANLAGSYLSTYFHLR